MNPFETEGAFSWFELMTSDVDEAKNFYGEVFGWNFKMADHVDMPYTLVTVEGQEIAGMMDLKHCGYEKIPPHWGNYVTVKEIEATVAKVKELGGTVIVEITPIPKVGDFAVIQDPQGAIISIIEYKLGC